MRGILLFILIFSLRSYGFSQEIQLTIQIDVDVDDRNLSKIIFLKPEQNTTDN